MPSNDDAPQTLRRLFREQRIADLETLAQVLDTTSRMTVFRRLKELGYYSSFTHSGRYYTLEGIPAFDPYGLWLFEGVGFSRFRTLKATLVRLIDEAAAGYTHAELEPIVRVRVHDPLRELVRADQIGRRRLGGLYLYVSRDPDRATGQVSRREALMQSPAPEPQALPLETVIAVLVETIAAGSIAVEPATVASRLVARGLHVSAADVAGVFVRYGLEAEKKTAGRPPPPSRG